MESDIKERGARRFRDNKAATILKEKGNKFIIEKEY